MAGKTIEYMCRYCGTKTRHLEAFGKPAPGICPRRPKDRSGRPQPHSWTVNRRF